jgi:hypothetical protein
MTLKGIVKDSIEPVLSNISGESFLRKFKGKLIKGMLYQFIKKTLC